jgi:hypothetical protein
VAGSVRTLENGSWELRVYLGRDDRGRVKHKSRTFRGTKREADRELTRTIVEFEGGLDALEEPADVQLGHSTTVNDAIEGWSLNGWGDLSPNTPGSDWSPLHVRGAPSSPPDNEGGDPTPTQPRSARPGGGARRLVGSQ